MCVNITEIYKTCKHFGQSWKDDCTREDCDRSREHLREYLEIPSCCSVSCCDEYMKREFDMAKEMADRTGTKMIEKEVLGVIEARHKGCEKSYRDIVGSELAKLDGEGPQMMVADLEIGRRRFHVWS